MPIEREEFEGSSEEALGVEEGTHADTVLTFLAENDDKAFTGSEIHDETGIKRGSVGAVLSRLKDAGLVEHKGRYWAVSERAKEESDEGGGVSAWKIL
jgi:predicted transcriptional regulator of viral defense system